jgi:hypothetical protein
MGRAFAWLYRRLGSRYLGAILGFEVFSAFVICLGTVGVLGIYEERLWAPVGVARGGLRVADGGVTVRNDR